MTNSSTANVLPFGDRTRAFERRRRVRSNEPGIRARSGGEGFEILNMSPQGMAVQTVHPYSIGATYLFELFDGERSLMVEGEVCWSRRNETTGTTTEPLEESRPVYSSGVSFVGIHMRTPGSIATESTELPLPESDTIEGESLVADRIERLQLATCPDAAAELLLEILSADFEHLVLFKIRDRVMRAWLGRGPTLLPERLMNLDTDFDGISIFHYLREGGSFFYGKLPPQVADLGLLRCWEQIPAGQCAIFPIRIKKRLVAVLYADTGALSLSAAHLGSLKAATDLFVDSLVRQILLRKAAPPEKR